jgi:hypothetical protein
MLQTCSIGQKDQRTELLGNVLTAVGFEQYFAHDVSKWLDLFEVFSFTANYMDVITNFQIPRVRTPANPHLSTTIIGLYGVNEHMVLFVQRLYYAGRTESPMRQ